MVLDELSFAFIVLLCDYVDLHTNIQNLLRTTSFLPSDTVRIHTAEVDVKAYVQNRREKMQCLHRKDLDSVSKTVYRRFVHKTWSLDVLSAGLLWNHASDLVGSKFYAQNLQRNPLLDVGADVLL